MFIIWVLFAIMHNIVKVVDTYPVVPHYIHINYKTMFKETGGKVNYMFFFLTVFFGIIMHAEILQISNTI